jgi:hypothetical protein
MKDTKYRKNKCNIRPVSIHVITGDYTDVDMYNAYNAGKKRMREWIDAYEANQYSGEIIKRKQPLFNEWIKTYKENGI